MGINLSKSKFNREMVSLSKMECIAEKSTCQKMPMHQINKCGGLKTPLKAQLLQRNEQIYGARSTQHVIATFERLIRCRCKFDSQGANNLRQKLQRFNQLRIFLWTKLGNNSSICDFNIDPFDEYSLKLLIYYRTLMKIHFLLCIQGCSCRQLTQIWDMAIKIIGNFWHPGEIGVLKWEVNIDNILQIQT